MNDEFEVLLDDEFQVSLDTAMNQAGDRLAAAAARQVTGAAQQTATTYRPTLQEAIEQKREKANGLPDWIIDNSVTIRKGYSSWELVFPIKVTIKEVVYCGRKYSVPAEKQKSVEVWLALPIESSGAFNVTSLRIVGRDLTLPHVDSGSACLALADGPTAVKSFKDYQAVIQSITRAMSQVNLASLYTYPDTWPRDIKQALPPGSRRGHASRAVLDKYFTEKDEDPWTIKDSNR